MLDTQDEQCKTPGIVLFTTLVWLSVLHVNEIELRAEDETMALILQSGAFNDGDEIPSSYTCEGRDIAPPLAWDGVPAETKSLVLIVDDPDAPDPKAPKMTWVHWVLYNIPADTTDLPEGGDSDDLPPGTGTGLNDWRRTDYGGPCPPIGRHRYFFKLYALNEKLRFRRNPTRKEVETAMASHIIDKVELIGTYKKK